MNQLNYFLAEKRRRTAPLLKAREESHTDFFHHVHGRWNRWRKELYQKEVILSHFAGLQNLFLFSLAETKADTGNNYSLKTQWGGKQ